MLQCDGRSMVSCVGSQRRRLRDAAYMKAPSVRPPCTQICMSLVIFGLEELRSDFWDGGKDALSHLPPTPSPKNYKISLSNNTWRTSPVSTAAVQIL